ncbi:glycosyltransferase family 2 protein [Vibrio metschnikovii]|uniref:glycosyltransferase family 2 protein n=1 Tax=Vibrio metschnikovii TaxID=28172 RepID=UPI001C2F3E9B|nr:glycosyltransferase family 2 protein [Vibrio metschnikovii]
MSFNKKIAICIPTYNRPSELKRLIDSIPEPYSVFVSNNGERLNGEKYGKRSKIYNHEVVLPIFENWNFPTQYVITDYILIPSDDDIYYEGAFDIIEKAIRENPSVDVFVWGCNFVDGEYNIIGSKPIINESRVLKNEAAFNMHKYSVSVRMPSFCIKKSLFDALGGFSTEMTLTASDSCLIQKALLSGDVYFGKEIISGYRVWSNSLTSQRNATKQWFEELDIWISEILSFAKLHDCEKIIPPDYREKIMYQNIRSAISTMKKNARSRKEQLYFLMDSAKNGYSKNILHILKLIAVILFKK